jgi:hypothetical protein
MLRCQALRSYHGGRMLFLGLGTGLGSTLIVEHAVVPLELGQLRCRKGKCCAGGIRLWERAPKVADAERHVWKVT